MSPAPAVVPVSPGCGAFSFTAIFAQPKPRDRPRSGGTDVRPARLRRYQGDILISGSRGEAFFSDGQRLPFARPILSVVIAHERYFALRKDSGNVKAIPGEV